MDKIAFLKLWDLYHGLLTPTQQEITDLYFNLDLTLSEIAEAKGISRQGVSECLHKCQKSLEEIEKKLGFSRLLEESDLAFSFRLTDIGRWAQAFKDRNPQFTDDISDLESIIERDYSLEVKEALNKS